MAIPATLDADGQTIRGFDDPAAKDTAIFSETQKISQLQVLQGHSLASQIAVDKIEKGVLSVKIFQKTVRISPDSNKKGIR